MEFPSVRLPRGQEIVVRHAVPANATEVLSLMRDAYLDIYVGSEATKADEPYIIQAADVHALLDPKDPTMIADLRGDFERRTTRDGDNKFLTLTAHPASQPEQLLGYAAARHGGILGKARCPEGTLYDTKFAESDVTREARRTQTQTNLGIGTVLMYSRASLLRNTYGNQTTAFLCVGTENLVAQTWYERLGWERTGHKPEANWPDNVKLPRLEMATVLGGLCINLEKRYPWLLG
jgi:ribosomal protein S18 acetylase RimI-like enzyme